MKKFKNQVDITFSNPPYKTLDLKIIKSLNFKKLICVHPATWILETKSRFGYNCSKLIRDFKNLTKNHIEKIEIFNPNIVFKVVLGNDCMISYFNFEKNSQEIITKFKNEKEVIIRNLNEISIFGSNLSLVNQLIQKLLNYIKINGSIEQHRTYRENALKFKDHFYAQFIVMVADPKRYYHLCQMKINRNSNEMKTYDYKCESGEIVFIFSTLKEKENFVNFTKTDFCRFCIALLKTSRRLTTGELNLVPWLDWTKSWNDDKLFTFFGFEKRHPLREYCKMFIDDYYKIGKDY